MINRKLDLTNALEQSGANQKLDNFVNPKKTVKIVIADDHHLFVAGLKTVLKESDKMDIEVIGVANTGKDLLSLLKVTEPELLLLDLNMPDGDGLGVLTEIKSSYPELRIITLTNYDEVKLVKSAFKAGVDGYILKTIGISELITAIDVVLEGKTFMGKGVKLNKNDLNGHKKGYGEQKIFEDKFIKKYNLTKRELEILSLIAQALSNKEIATELFISDQTVSVHRKNIMRKLGVSNIAALIKIAYDNRLI